jgi:hypothetical protein
MTYDNTHRPKALEKLFAQFKFDFERGKDPAPIYLGLITIQRDPSYPDRFCAFGLDNVPWPTKKDHVVTVPIDDVPLITNHLFLLIQFLENEHADILVLQMTRGFICFTRLRRRGLIAVATRELCHTLKEHEEFPPTITFEDEPEPELDFIEWDGAIPGICGPQS